MIETDEVLLSESGKEYRVLSQISEGTGQGDIYLVSCEGVPYAMKLFFADAGNAATERQIRSLMKRDRPCAAYVHPIDLLHAEGRVGYVMEYIPDTYLPGAVLCNGIEGEDGRREELPFAVRLAVLYNIAEALSVLYHANLAMMDLKFDNLKINPEDWSVKILDTDTVVGEGGHTFVEGTVGFMPPLTMRREEEPDRHNDAYALAVIIFMTLLGQHPLEGEMANVPHDCDLGTYLFEREPLYVFHPTDTRNRPDEEHTYTVDKWLRYPRDFVRGMEMTFVDGLFDKEKRTTPGEWCRILRDMYDSSYVCLSCGEEQFFSAGGGVCDGCGAELAVPLLLSGEKSLPLYFGLSVSLSELFPDSGEKEPFLTVGASPYPGKYGFLVEGEAIGLCLPGGKTVTFSRGKTVPLILAATYTYKQERFTIKEA